MAPTEIKVSPEMEALISEGGIDATPIMEAATPYAPVYRIVGEAKIPVSKYLGTLWKTRKDNGIASRKETEEASGILRTFFVVAAFGFSYGIIF